MELHLKNMITPILFTECKRRELFERKFKGKTHKID